jgi:hypothetical protein
MASRVAAELKKESEIEVEIIGGGLGEFSVSINDRKVVDTNRLWYPMPGKVVTKVRSLLNE